MASNPKFKVAFTCGGTGGHVYPAVALAQEIGKEADNENVCFIVSGKRQDKTILDQFNFQSFSCASTRKNPLILLKAIFQARRILKRENVTTVVGTGGYFTAPVLIAAWLLKLPIYLCEQNVLPGRVTSLFAPLAKKVFLSFEESLPYLTDAKEDDRFLVTGNPIRETYLEDALFKHVSSLPFPKKKTVLVFGGSQAAEFINTLFIKEYDYFMTSEYVLIHLVGADYFERLSKQFPDDVNKVVDDGGNEESSDEGIDKGRGNIITRYHNNELKMVILPYFENMAYLYRLADKVVCRAGASSISELLQYQKDAFLIPYPYAGNHQEDNAKAFVRLGMGEYKNQESVTFRDIKTFLELLNQTIQDKPPHHPTKVILKQIRLE